MSWEPVLLLVGVVAGISGTLIAQSLSEYRRRERVKRALSHPVPVMRLRVNETTALADRERALQHQRNWHPKQSTQPTPMTEEFDFDGD